MSFGSINPPAEAMAATQAGATGAVERLIHVYDVDSEKHTWAEDDEGNPAWIEDPYLKPVAVRLDSDQQPNTCRIKMEGTRVEDWTTYLKPADQLRVVLWSEETVINDDGENEVATNKRIVFRGFPAAVAISGSPATEDITVMCMGWRYYLNRIACYDQWVYGKSSAGADVDFKATRKLVFNIDGRMNRMSKGGFNGTGRHTDDKSFLFTYPAIAEQDVEWVTEAVAAPPPAPGTRKLVGHDFWSAGDAVEYLVNRFQDPDNTLTLGLNVESEDFLALNEIRLPELDVDGKSLTEAITMVLAAVGYHWNTRTNLNTGRWELAWWKDGVGLKKYDVQFPNHATDLADAESKTEAYRFDVNYDYKNIANSYIGAGAVGQYENDWELEKAWFNNANPPVLISGTETAEHYYRSGWDGTVNPDWEKYKNVFRRWAFDGAGLNTGTTYDFAGLIGGRYEERPRFLDDQALTTETDNEGNRLPAQLFCHHDGTWKRVDGNVDVLSEGLQDGIYIDGTRITVDGGTEAQPIKDIMTDVDKTEVIAGIKGDLGIEETVEDSDSQQVHMTRQKALRSEDFKYEYAHGSEYGAAATLRDDTAKLKAYLGEKLTATKDPILSASITLPLINYEFRPGTMIGKILGRDITLNSVVVAVDMNLENNDMQLSLADTRLRSFM